LIGEKHWPVRRGHYFCIIEEGGRDMDFMKDYGWYLAGAGAVFGFAASMWSKVQSIAWRIMNIAVQRIEIPTQAGHEAVTAYLISKFKRSRNYDRMYGASWEFQRDGRYGLIPYEQFGNRTLILWNGWFPFLYSNQQEAKSTTKQDNHNSNATKVYSTLTFIRGTLNVEKILQESCDVRNSISWAAEEAEQKSKTRFVIHHVPKRGDSDSDNDYGSNGLAWYQQGTYRLISHKPDDLGKRPTMNGKALDNLIFPQRIKDLIKEIELWRKSREWYREKGIPWKRGWMLYGPPGTGKTALARAFAEDMNMPIYVYNLAEMSNHELMRTWSEMQMNVPCIALIEDIDNVFHGRENVARKNSGIMMGMPMPKKDDDSDNDRRGGGMMMPLTFDCLLNCLDGVERSDGIFTIISTNDITKIDPALGLPRKLPDGVTEFISTRPGRIDKAVELGYMETNDKKKMAGRILGAYEKEHMEMLHFVDHYPDLQETPAQFQERCAQIALKCFWNEQNLAKQEAREYEMNGKAR
jgi:ATPase family associated with various cellular activities (AAA)